MEHWINVMVDNPGVTALTAITTLGVLAAIGFFIYDRRASVKAYLEHRRSIRIQRGLAMGKKKKAERQAFVKQSVADILTDGFEELWLAGKVTREEVNSVYRMIAKTHHIPDLLPVLTPEQVKKAIKIRRAHGVNTPGQEKPAWGDPPSTTNDEKSGVSNVVDAAKRFGAKALALKKTG